MSRTSWCLGLGAVALVSLPATAILWLPGYLATNDGIFHLTRTIDHLRVLHSGVWYPRWLPGFGLGHGYPIFDYYPPLSTYLAEALHLAGLELTRAIQVETAIFCLLAGMLMYLFAADLFGSALAGFTAGIFYVYFPFHLTDVYVRGDLAEVVAYALMPLCLWAFRRLVLARSSAWLVAAAASLALLVLAHNITALAFMPVLLLYLAWLTLYPASGGPWRQAARPLLAVPLGLALSAFYWAPAILDAPYAHIADFTDPTSTPSKHIWPVTDLIQLRWFFDYDLNRYRLGLTPAALALLALAVGEVRGRRAGSKAPSSASTAWLFAGVALVCLFMMSNPSAFIWEHVPLLKYLQFGWRGLFLIGLALSVVSGQWTLSGQCTVNSGERVSRSPVHCPLSTVPFVALATIVLMATSLRDLPRLRLAIPPDQLTAGVLARYEYGNAANGKGADAEFLPSATDPAYVRLGAGPRPTPRVSDAPLPDSVTMTRSGLTWLEAGVRSGQQSRLRFHIFYFPGWTASIDGAAAPVSHESDAGLVAVDLPPGSHTLRLSFAATPLRLGAGLVSLAATAVALAVALRRLLPAGRRLVPALATGALLLGGCATTPEAAPIRAADHHFGGMRLIGYRLPASAPGQPLRVELFWLNRAATEESRQVELNLAEPGGSVVAWLGEPPYYGVSPTWTWVPGELVRDEHELRLPPGPARDLELSLAVSGSPGTPLALGRVAVPAMPPEPPLKSLEADFDGKVRLLGYRLGARPAFPWLPAAMLPSGGADLAVKPGDWLSLQLRWQALASMNENYTTFVHLIDEGKRSWSEKDNQPDGTLRPTSGWLPGDMVDDNFLLALPRVIPPAIYHFEVGMYRFPEMRFLQHKGGDSLIFGSVKVPLSPAQPPSPALADFGGILLGAATAEMRDGEIEVRLTWEPRVAPAKSYTVFVQLLNPTGKLVAQHDREPRAGSYPTFAWVPGEVIPDRHLVRLPSGLPPGEYTLIAGLYGSDGGPRLRTSDGADHIVLRRLALP